MTEMNLVAAMRREYDSSETLLWIGISVKAAIYLGTIATAALSSGFAATLILILGSVGQAFLFVSRLLMRSHLSLGERLRRLAMLRDGVGREPTLFETAILPERVWNAPGAGVPDPYYSSPLPKGSKRLVDVTAECAFFSGRISGAAWTLFRAVSVFALSALVLSLVLVAVLGTAQSRIEVVAKCVLIGITFWATEDLIDMALGYRELMGACEKILQECLRLLGEENPSMEDAYVALHEYDAAVADAPPLPGRIYRRRNEELSKIWQEMRRSGTTRGTA
jgi:hypothetical protein